MKIHSICLVKNESDIIAQTLQSAACWSDFIYVYDNGSTDGTWEQVLDLARKYKQIIPYKQDSQPFANSLRSEPFNHYRANSTEKDWWCKLDADEIYIDNPRIFLSKIPKKFAMVWAASFEYYFTDRDLEFYNQNPALYADDISIEKKCRYYINNWSEPLFFRYKENLIWKKSIIKSEAHMPDGIANPYHKRIRLKHFQYRSPQQIQKSLDNRIELMQKGVFLHEKRKDWKQKINNADNASYSSSNFSYDKDYLPCSWQERVASASNLLYDRGDGKYIINEDLIPKIPVVNRSFYSRVLNKLLQTYNSSKNYMFSDRK